MKAFFTNFGTATLLLLAIIFGSLIGWLSPTRGEALGAYIDPLILILVALLFFEIQFEKLRHISKHVRFLSVAWVANFLIIPTIGFLVASLFLSGAPLLFTGVLIYFLAPCTDWFLGFTKLAKGNTALGAALIPINMVSQLLLYPVYLALFAHQQAAIDIAKMGDTLVQWFIVPLVGAVAMHYLAKYLLSEKVFKQLLALAGNCALPVIAALIFCIFSANINTLASHTSSILLVLCAVVVFFTVVYWLSTMLSRRFRFSYPEHALLTIMTAARNTPLMLAVTMVALPNQPLIYAALIIGMLIEFPHLTLLKQLLLRQKKHYTYDKNS